MKTAVRTALCLLVACAGLVMASTARPAGAGTRSADDSSAAAVVIADTRTALSAQRQAERRCCSADQSHRSVGLSELIEIHRADRGLIPANAPCPKQVAAVGQHGYDDSVSVRKQAVK